MNTIFAALLEETKVSGDLAAIAAMESALTSGTFFVEVICTMSGQYAMGSTSVTVGNKEIDIPAIYTSKCEVLNCILEERDRYAEEIEEGERDEDDEYEGQLMIAKWDGGKNISFHCPDTGIKYEEGDWRWHAGI
tara:strand:+ start:619 stop:1023 length:405 start_codon:yes stop_codon:yes gene_type:complete